MSHTQVGFVVWRASGRDRVIDVGQFVGGCTQEGYAAAVPRSRTRGVLLGVVCDGRGVAAGALAVIDVVRSGNMLVVRTADVRAPGRRLAHDRVVTRVPLDGANEIRAATEEEMMRARDEIGSW